MGSCATLHAKASPNTTPTGSQSDLTTSQRTRPTKSPRSTVRLTEPTLDLHVSLQPLHTEEDLQDSEEDAKMPEPTGQSQVNQAGENVAAPCLPSEVQVLPVIPPPQAPQAAAVVQETEKKTATAIQAAAPVVVQSSTAAAVPTTQAAATASEAQGARQAAPQAASPPSDGPQAAVPPAEEVVTPENAPQAATAPPSAPEAANAPTEAAPSEAPSQQVAAASSSEAPHPAPEQPPSSASSEPQQQAATTPEAAPTEAAKAESQPEAEASPVQTASTEAPAEKKEVESPSTNAAPQAQQKPAPEQPPKEPPTIDVRSPRLKAALEASANDPDVPKEDKPSKAEETPKEEPTEEDDDDAYRADALFNAAQALKEDMQEAGMDVSASATSLTNMSRNLKTYNLLLMLQKEMAVLQLKLSHIGDSMRATNNALEEVMEFTLDQMAGN